MNYYTLNFLILVKMKLIKGVMKYWKVVGEVFVLVYVNIYILK